MIAQAQASSGGWCVRSSVIFTVSSLTLTGETRGQHYASDFPRPEWRGGAINPSPLNAAPALNSLQDGATLVI
jgi:hypothetical protein